jgi:dienelactone hydrolase
MRRTASLTVALLLGSLGCGDDGGGAPADSGIPTDGNSSGADAAPSSDPALPGSYTPDVTDAISIPIGGDTATATLCAPTGDTGAPYPLVVVSPGFQLPRDQYRSMCEHLASWGYVVIVRDYLSSSIFDPPNHRDLADNTITIIDWALASEDAARIDASKIATAGHSLGGKTSIFTAILDDRVGATVGWDPVDAKPPVDNGSPSVTPEEMPNLDVPMAVIGETTDTSGGMPCAPADDNFEQYYQYACGAPAVQVTVDGADHMDWVDDRASCGLTCSFCADGSRDDAETRAITRRLTVAFLDRHLRGNAAMDAYLSAAGIGSGTAWDEKSGCP